MKTNNQIWKKIRSLFLVLAFFTLGACGRQEEQEDVLMMRAETAEGAGEDEPALALILTSKDSEENSQLVKDFREKADEQGVRLLVKIPDVTEEEAQEARRETGNFVLCDVNPIEYQMLFVNELVAEDVDVIAIHANHSEALEPVLTAARSLGIRICAFEQKVGEESCDVYTTAADAANASVGLLDM